MSEDNPEADRLIGELSDLAIRILHSGGPGALASCAVALVEGAAAGTPGPLIPKLCEDLLQAVASGARIAGHTVDVVDVSQEVH